HAFVDVRRFARIRLIDCPASTIRQVSPLAENGPDPVIDRAILTEEWLVQKLRSKHVPVKALLLDQANISGIGNWVGDELLYDARIHPEQYSDTLTPAQMAQLHRSIMYVCSTAVELRAESDRFPETWLFKYRWGKGKKDDPRRLPSGEKIKFLTVGGRTSAVVPSVQRKTGGVARDIVDDDDDEGEEEEEKKKPARKKRGKKSEDSDEGEEPSNQSRRKKKSPKQTQEDEDQDQDQEATTQTPLHTTETHAVKKKEEEEDAVAATPNDIPPPPTQQQQQLPERKRLPPSNNPPRMQKMASTAKQAASTESSPPKDETASELPQRRRRRRRSARVSSSGAGAK
ncbi:MAG: hypothetical protein Q9210_004385, partial [Variospora velana]